MKLEIFWLVDLKALKREGKMSVARVIWLLYFGTTLSTAGLLFCSGLATAPPAPMWLASGLQDLSRSVHK